MSQRWNAYAKKTAILEAQYNPKIRKVIQALYSSFLTDLKQHGTEQAKANLNRQIISQDLLTVLQSIYTKAGVMGARLTYNELQQSIRQGKELTSRKAGALPEKSYKAAGFGKNPRWIAAVLNYLKLNLYEFAAKILNTTREDILALLDKGIKEGMGIDQIVQLFTQSTRPVSRTRLIVRTEINRAANVGHAIGAQSFPYEVNKKWIAAKDHRVRHSHRDVADHVTDEQGTFNVPVYNGLKPTGQTVAMQAPGDPSAPASLTVNCRCRIIHEAKRDGNGQLISRSGNTAVVIPLRATPAQLLPEISIAAQGKALADAIVMEVK